MVFEVNFIFLTGLRRMFRVSGVRHMCVWVRTCVWRAEDDIGCSCIGFYLIVLRKGLSLNLELIISASSVG